MIGLIGAGAIVSLVCAAFVLWLFIRTKEHRDHFRTLEFYRDNPPLPPKPGRHVPVNTRDGRYYLHECE